MAYNRFNDGNAQPWPQGANQECLNPSNAARMTRSGVNQTPRPYAAQPTRGVDEYATNWNNTSFGSTASNVLYSANSGYQGPPPTAYCTTSGGNTWQSPQIMPEHQISSPSYETLETHQYSHLNRATRQVGGYLSPARGYDNITSYLPQSGQASDRVDELLNRHDPSVTSMPPSSQTQAPINVHYPSAAEQQRADDYSVQCPYRCGAVLTGMHALGNLTRHLKSKACPGNGQAKVTFPCPITNCYKEYARSDGLRVHMRKHHGAPPATAGAEDE